MLPSSGWKIGRIFGIDIVINASWLLILFLFTLTFGDIFRTTLANGRAFPTGPWTWIAGFITSVILFASLLTHELSHSYVASRSGVQIRRITLFVFGGVAEMSEDVPTAATEFRMAIAGPLAPFVLAGLFYALYRITNAMKLSPVIVIPLISLAAVNLAVGIFNLVPAFPLDGGRVLRSILWRTTGDLRKATRVASIAGQVFAVLLGGTGLVFLIRGYLITGIWPIFLGVYIYVLATASYRQTLLRIAASDTKVQDVMFTGFPLADSHVHLTQLRENYFAVYRLPVFPVADTGNIVGVVHRDDLDKVSRAEWDLLDAGRIMRPLSSVKVVPPDMSLDRAMRQILRGDDFILVMDGPKFLGLLTRDEVLRYVQTKMKPPEK